MNFENLKAEMLEFRKDRNWEQFHDAKNLSMALSIEAGELMEHFLWVDKVDVEEFSDEKITLISEEIADVFIYLFYLSHGLKIDIETAVSRKLELNAIKYPIEKAYESLSKHN